MDMIRITEDVLRNSSWNDILVQKLKHPGTIHFHQRTGCMINKYTIITDYLQDSIVFNIMEKNSLTTCLRFNIHIDDLLALRQLAISLTK